jgi:sortase A
MWGKENQPVPQPAFSRITLSLLILFISMLVLSACVSRTATTSQAEPEPTETPVPPEPTPAPTVEPEDEEEEIPAKPVRFQIDSIDVDAEVEHVAQDDQGRMDVPSEWEDVAWYELGPVPGEQGNAVIAGHYDSFIGPAVFFDLRKLEEGDILRVITEDDEELEFEIFEIESVHIDDADSRKIFGKTEEYNLNLVTCEGIWDPDTDMYDHRLIVYSRLIES